MVCFCSLGYDVTARRPLASTAKRCAWGLFFQETRARGIFSPARHVKHVGFKGAFKGVFRLASLPHVTKAVSGLFGTHPCARTHAHAMSSCSGFPQNTPFGSSHVEQKVHPCGAQHVSIQVFKCGEKNTSLGPSFGVAGIQKLHGIVAQTP